MAGTALHTGGYSAAGLLRASPRWLPAGELQARLWATRCLTHFLRRAPASRPRAQALPPDVIEGLGLDEDDVKQMEAEVDQSRQEADDEGEADVLEEQEMHDAQRVRVPPAVSDFTELVKTSDLEVGQKLIGEVRDILDHGLLVDVGADRLGLLHLKQIAVHVKNIYRFFKIGQSIRVSVHKVTGTGALELTTRARRISDGSWKPNLTAFVDLPTKQWLVGNVSSVAEYGFFVMLEPPGGGKPVAGLVHKSDIRAGYVMDPRREVEVGQPVGVRVLHVDTVNYRLRLSMRPSRGSRGGEGSAKYDFTRLLKVPPHEWLEGEVYHIAPIGIFFEVQPPGGGVPVEGLVRLRDIRDGELVEDPAEVVEIGGRYPVRIIGANAERGQLRLSMRPLPPLSSKSD